MGVKKLGVNEFKVIFYESKKFFAEKGPPDDEMGRLHMFIGQEDHEKTFGYLVHTL